MIGSHHVRLSGVGAGRLKVGVLQTVEMVIDEERRCAGARWLHVPRIYPAWAFREGFFLKLLTVVTNRAEDCVALR
jgi:hypothetical protein